MTRWQITWVNLLVLLNLKQKEQKRTEGWMVWKPGQGYNTEFVFGDGNIGLAASSFGL